MALKPVIRVDGTGIVVTVGDTGLLTATNSNMHRFQRPHRGIYSFPLPSPAYGPR